MTAMKLYTCKQTKLAALEKSETDWLSGVFRLRAAYSRFWTLRFLIVMALSSSVGRAAIWYVDGSVGSSGDGRSWATAWKTMSNISGVSAGDTVFISGGPSGSTQSYSLSNWSPVRGNSGASVIYKIGQDPAHNGTAAFNGTGQFFGIAPSYVTFSGDAGDGAMHFSLNGYSAMFNGGSLVNFRFSYVNLGTLNPGVTGHVWALGVDSGNSNIEIDHVYNYLTTGDGWFWISKGTAASTWDVVRIHDVELYLPKNGAYGTDGIQFQGDGISLYNSKISAYSTSYSGGQHQDAWQSEGGNYLKAYNNTFANLGNSALYLEGWGNYNHVLFFNNVIRLTDGLGDYGIHLTTGEHAPTADTINDAVVANNVVDGGGAYGYSIVIQTYSGTGSYSGCTCVNNVAISNGKGASAGITLLGVTGGVSSSGNTTLTASQAGSYFQSYTAGSLNNDYHLNSVATALIGKGVNLYSTYPQVQPDKDGNLRGTSGAWDLGAYVFGNVSTNPVIQVAGGLSFGSVNVGSTNTISVIVQNIGSGTLAGNASVAAPFSIVSGGSYSLSANQSQTVVVAFNPKSVGSFTSPATFTGGGGATIAATGSGVNPPPVVSAISQSGSDVDSTSPGLQVYAGSVVQYSASASDPNGLPLTWQWAYSLNGAADVIVQNGSGTIAPISFNYTAGMAGGTFVWKLRVSNGSSTSESDLTVGVEAPPPPAGTLTFSAGSGLITPPFVLSNGYISQSVSTGVTNGGQAVYNFTITNAGNYVLQVAVNAVDAAANSLYLNIDGLPLDPSMIWDIPVTSGFEQRLVSWRGNGTADADEFVPQIFTLGVGTHQLIVVGREPNVQLQSFAILQLPPPPQNLHVVSQ